MTTTNQARTTFLDYFGKNAHEVRPSSSLVPQNDPTLMFANAGMNQFKNVFTGTEKLPYSRAASSQKCVRAGGKHNDLDNVGYTARHHTFFEMLGNFSFGDYFKEDAIKFAWELLTKDYGIDPRKLSFTVYHTDDEAFNLWKKITGCDDSKILRIPTKDNFWSMGDTGPCGPCSEIFYDHGEKAGNGEWALNADGSDRFDARFVEIWNLVFMQYEQIDADTRIDLPKPSIDTGMGLERIAAVMQGVFDNYDIDLFKNIITNIKDEAGALGAQPAKESAPYKVIADHLRSSCFLIADGVLPSNEGRGYVLRRIMRRAMRYAHQLGCKDPLMFKLVPSLINEMGAQYPELKRAEATITENLRAEEERFKETLGRGLKLLDEESASLSKGDKLNGEAAFKLYDTYGFPLDLTQDILKARGIEVDTDGFDKAMENQRDMARSAHKGSGDTATGKIWFELKEKLGPVKFIGYDENETDAQVLAIVKENAEVPQAAANDDVFIILNQTPFYGESGGQVGDTGELANTATILDTQKPLEDFIVHKAKLKTPLKIGDKVRATIDVTRRTNTISNHSATHLLHKALRDTLGDHVTQKGSLVSPDRLRFDFSHGKAVAKDELATIENAVNAQVAMSKPVLCREMAPEDAIAAGAMALFGEKYGDTVRVLTIGNSVELCGGVHVKNTGDIGLFKVTSEGSVASGIRRVEAVTGEGVRAYMIEQITAQNEAFAKLAETNARLAAEAGIKATDAVSVAVSEFEKAPLASLSTLFASATQTLEDAIATITEDNKKLTKLAAEAKKKAALGNVKISAEAVNGVNFVGHVFDGLDAKELRALADDYLKQFAPAVVAIATNADGKASVVVAVDNSLTEKYSAVAFVQSAVTELGGKGGGGKPNMAQGGGPDISKLESALALIKSKL